MHENIRVPANKKHIKILGAVKILRIEMKKKHCRGNRYPRNLVGPISKNAQNFIITFQN